MELLGKYITYEVYAKVHKSLDIREHEDVLTSKLRH